MFGGFQGLDLGRPVSWRCSATGGARGCGTGKIGSVNLTPGDQLDPGSYNPRTLILQRSEKNG